MDKGLRHFPAFQQLTEPQAVALEQVLVRVRHPAGRVLVKAGDQEDHQKDQLFVILDGKVMVRTDPQSASQVRVERELGPGEMFGLVSLLKGGPRTATCKANGPVVVATLTRAQFEELVKANPEAASALLFVLGAQLAKDIRACNTGLVQAIEQATVHVGGATATLRKR